MKRKDAYLPTLRLVYLSALQPDPNIGFPPLLGMPSRIPQVLFLRGDHFPSISSANLPASYSFRNASMIYPVCTATARFFVSS